MGYGICALSVLPLRETAQHNSSLISEVLYGEMFKITISRKFWSKVQLLDNTEGWLENNQFIEISSDTFKSLCKQKAQISTDLVELIYEHKKILFPIPIGSAVQHSSFLGHTYEGEISTGKAEKHKVAETSLTFLNSPFRHGGRTPFGIDAGGFVQMVYKLCGFELPRTAVSQADIGVPMSFIEETEPGDLAFFDNNEGEIIHVGIILENNYIIHAYGTVRIDRIDQSGIFNAGMRTHTHKLRLLKSVS